MISKWPCYINNFMLLCVLFVNNVHKKAKKSIYKSRNKPNIPYGEILTTLFMRFKNHVIQLYAYSLHCHVITIQMLTIDFTPKQNI